jgi:cytochrome bd ubiquinol oxidase subunit I
LAFHYLYPPLSIGLGVCLVIMEGLWLKTKATLYHQMARFWTKVFALTFAIGVATGIVMEFEFGTNWATYSRFVGDVFGSALAAEGIFAFFLESGFLAVLLFGWDKVGRKLHFFATCMVCLGRALQRRLDRGGQLLDADPGRLHIVGEGSDARAEITDFWAMVFNPSSMDRSATRCAVAGRRARSSWSASAPFTCCNANTSTFAKRSLKVGLAVGLVASLLQLVTGHDSAKGVARESTGQAGRLRGHYETGPPTRRSTCSAGWTRRTSTFAGWPFPGC